MPPLLHADFLQHLAHNNFDMLIVDFHTLQTVYTLYLVQHVILYSSHALNLQNIVGVNASFGQHIARLPEQRRPEP